MAYEPVKYLDLQISTFRGVVEDVDIPVLSKNPTDVIKEGDEILCCLEFDTEAVIATCKDVTANVTVSRNGYITNDTAPTSVIWTGLLFWRRLNDAGSGAAIGPIALKAILVAGGSAAADLVATGFELGDPIIAAFHLTTAAEIGTLDDITHLVSEGSVTAKIQCSIATTSDHILLFFHDANGTAYNYPSIQFALLDGTTAVTNIALTGAAVGDPIVFVGHITTKAAVASIADLTTEGEVTTAGQFQMSTTDTSNDLLFVIWLDVA